MAPRASLGALRLAAAAASLARAVAGEEAGEGEEHVSGRNLALAVMLLGSIAFMMGLFYLVNLRDQQLRMYSWTVISATISIFSAVLVFQALNGVIEHVLRLWGSSEDVELLVGFLTMLVSLACLQITLAYISGAIGRPPRGKWAVEKMELDLQCWTVLLGHIAGFATIHAFAQLQQRVPRNLLLTVLVAPLCWLFLYLFCVLTERVRTAVALSDDGKYDEAESKWDEQTAETEDDVIGLAVSFLLVQWLRYAIGGVLPNQEGDEEPVEIMFKHTWLQVLMLLGAGVLIITVDTARNLLGLCVCRRLTPQLQHVAAMCFAWSFFFGSKWLLLLMSPGSLQGGMLTQIVLALFVTAVSLALIFILDKADDAKGTPDDFDKAVRAVCVSLGILIGFSWERTFERAVHSIAVSIEFPDFLTELFMAACLATVVIPAWRWYILPTIRNLKAEDAREEDEEEEVALTGRSRSTPYQPAAFAAVKELPPFSAAPTNPYAYAAAPAFPAWPGYPAAGPAVMAYTHMPARGAPRM